MQTARDTYNQLEYAKKKGREEGLQQVLQQGHEQGREERSRVTKDRRGVYLII